MLMARLSLYLLLLLRGLLLLLHDLCVAFLQSDRRSHGVAQELLSARVDAREFLVIQLLAAERVHTLVEAELDGAAEVRDGLRHAHLLDVLLHLAFELALAHLGSRGPWCRAVLAIPRVMDVQELRSPSHRHCNKGSCVPHCPGKGPPTPHPILDPGSREVKKQRPTVEDPSIGMSSAAWASWLDRLESARGQQNALASKIRSGNGAAAGTSVFALQQTVSRLKRDFDQLKRSSGSSVTKQEMDRRERLLQQLVQDQKSDMDAYNKRSAMNGSNNLPRDQAGKLLTMQTQIMKDQDQQLDLISKGVSNLKNYSVTMKDETALHVRLLDDIDHDVSRATDGLETEGARAAQVARQSSNFKLYVIILILFAILIFLLVAGS